MLDIRNWTFHNPQSMLVAAKEAAEKNIPKEFRGMVKIQPQLNPVIITKVEKYELIKLASLVMYSEKSISDFEKVLESMKNDYQEMYDSISGKQLVMGPFGFTSNVQYCERFITSSISDYQSDVAQISMAIQKSKYDGSEENYKKFKLINEVQDATTEGLALLGKMMKDINFGSIYVKISEFGLYIKNGDNRKKQFLCI